MRSRTGSWVVYLLCSVLLFGVSMGRLEKAVKVACEVVINGKLEKCALSPRLPVHDGVLEMIETLSAQPTSQAFSLTRRHVCLFRMKSLLLLEET